MEEAESVEVILVWNERESDVNRMRSDEAGQVEMCGRQGAD